MDLYHPVNEKNVTYFIIGYLTCQIWRILYFLVWAIHGMAPGAKMAAPWCPKLIPTFRGHMDLYHPVSEKNVTYFIIGYTTC